MLSIQEIIELFNFYIENFLRFAYFWGWIVVPFFLPSIIEKFWIYNIIFDHFKNNKYVYLRIKVPREQIKSPLLMENVVSGCWTIIGDQRHFMDLYVFGVKDDYFSLEIAGVEGEIFYVVWVRQAKAGFLKNHIYSQYPDAEIEEMEEDYLNIIPDDTPEGDWDMWGLRWTLNKPDAYPIKTYKHFEDSVTGSMIDPIASFMEVLSDLGPGEVIVYQLLVNPVLESEWRDDFRAEVERLLDRGKSDEKKSVLQEAMKHFETLPMDTVSAVFKYPEPGESSSDDSFKLDAPFLRLSPGEQEFFKELEASHGKRAFKCQYGTVYFGKKDVINRSKFVGAMMGVVSQFTHAELNGFNVYVPYMTSTKYWMEKTRVKYIKRLLLRITKQRKFSGEPYILNSEEVASLWHFPDMSIKAPKTPWVPAKKASAPANLPVSREDE